MKREFKFKSINISWITILFIVSCNLSFPIGVSCPIEDLLIVSSNLPGNQWEEIGSRSYRDVPSKLGINRIGTSFSTPTYGIAIEDVFKFSNETEAKAGYIELAERWFGLEPEGTSWKKLNFPFDEMVNASEYRLECSVRPAHSNRTCWYIARYQNLVIEFKVDMLIVNDQDLFMILDVIDQNVQACTGS
jgi:hypothetical protein